VSAPVRTPGGAAPTDAITATEVAAVLRRHLPIYRLKPPSYQTVLLNDLRALWSGRHERLLDIGGGTGVIAECLLGLFPVGSVRSIDVVDRFCPTLTVATSVYDGTSLPFPDASFDAATLVNMLHHVPVAVRPDLIAEVRRVVRGPLYIKDHLAEGTLDRRRLAALDWIGNTPFRGMVEAEYLTEDDWRALAAAGAYRIAARAAGRYRGGLFARAFPNRLETTMRWEPI
jgi:SAM-dependent methyltransferase